MKILYIVALEKLISYDYILIFKKKDMAYKYAVNLEIEIFRNVIKNISPRLKEKISHIINIFEKIIVENNYFSYQEKFDNYQKLYQEVFFILPKFDNIIVKEFPLH